MRYIFFVVSVLILMQGCSPKPVFRMEPATEKTEFSQGTEYLYLEKDGIEVTLSYYRHLGKYFVMDVEIVNDTDSVLRVDPQQFGYDAYKFTSVVIPWDSKNKMTSSKAVNPEKELLKTDKAIARKKANQNTAALLFAIGQAAYIGSAIAADSEEEREEIYEQSEETYTSYENNQYRRNLEKQWLRDKREVWEIDALRITDLYPGEYIRGYLFFDNQPNARGYIIRFEPGEKVFNFFFQQKKYQP